MFDFQLRLATPHDFTTIIHFVHALLSEMYHLSSGKLSDHSEAWLDFERRILQALSDDVNARQTYPCTEDHLVEIAETIGGGALPIGLIEASILHSMPIFRPEQVLYIHALYVASRYRCHGVGTSLLRAAIAWGRQQHCSRAQLSVLPQNPSRRLYQELGFTVDGLEMLLEMGKEMMELQVPVINGG